MNSEKLWDTKSIHRNHLHSYILIMNNVRNKGINPFHHCNKKNKISRNKPTQWRRQWHPTPVLLPGKSHGWRSLEGCSPWGRWGSDTTERLHFSLSCIGEGNGNPLQCSCLENPRDGEAWWAAVYGVAQSRTRQKQLSSSMETKELFTENFKIQIKKSDDINRYSMFLGWKN